MSLLGWPTQLRHSCSTLFLLHLTHFVVCRFHDEAFTNSIHNSGNCLPHSSVIHLFSPPLYLLSISLYHFCVCSIWLKHLHFSSFLSHVPSFTPTSYLFSFSSFLYPSLAFQSVCCYISAYYSLLIQTRLLLFLFFILHFCLFLIPPLLLAPFLFLPPSILVAVPRSCSPLMQSI